MRKLGDWGAALALVVGLGATAFAGDGKPKNTAPRPASWRSTTVWEKTAHALSSAEKPADEKKASDKKADDKAKKPADAAPAKAEPAELVTHERARAEAAFLRRSAACLKLREVALRNGDTDLLKRIDQLDEKAWAAYTDKTAALAAEGVEVDSDEGAVERYLGSGKGVKLPKDDAKKYTVPGADATRRADAKEGKK